MSQPTPFDLATWPRRDHFEFFRRYRQPYWNVTAEVDVTALVEACARPGAPSFFLASLHAALCAANQVEELRLRIRGDASAPDTPQVVLHASLDGGSTVLMPDDTFRFAYFGFEPELDRFAAAGERILAQLRAAPGGLEAREHRDDLIHFSVLPWIAFSSFQHARPGVPTGVDSVPKIVLGKHRPVNGRRALPVSIEVHHALVDGLHVGRFFEHLQRTLQAPIEAQS